MRRTWSRRGHTPELQQEGSWHKLSVIGALSLQPSGRLNEQFQIYRHNIRRDDFIYFIRSMYECYRKPLIVVWDGLRQHQQTEQFFKIIQANWVDFIRLPPYSPELNPVESLWSSTKANTLANFAPHDLNELQPEVEAALAGVKTRQSLLRGFFWAAGLDPGPVGNFARTQ